MRYEACVGSLSQSRNIGCLVMLSLGLVCLLGGMAAAQGIVVNETGLHDYEEVYGIDASAAVDPVTNTLPVSLSAAGETNPSLFANVSFYAYGIYAEPNGANSGDVTVQGLGGNANGANTITSFAGVYGIYVKGDGNNSGAVSVDVLGGEVTATGAATTRASSSVDAYGIYSWSAIDNSGDVNVVGTGTSAQANGARAFASAGVWAAGLNAAGTGSLWNTASLVDVNAVGGVADATGTDYANASVSAFAYGLDSRHDVNNEGAVTTTATGGTARANSASETDAYARAISRAVFGAGDSIVNSGAITAIARGGAARANSLTDSNAEAYADADGIIGKEIENSGPLTVTALGGDAIAGTTAYAYADANGIYAMDRTATNSGLITVRSTGGTADANDYAGADAAGHGIFTSDANAVNSGAIDVVVMGGNADADGTGSVKAEAFSLAYGVNAAGNVDNQAGITVSAVGGRAVAASDTSADADAAADAFGIRTSNANVTNTHAINATARGGTAQATADDPEADATAFAGGIYAHGSAVDNSGRLTVAATGGTAQSEGTLTDDTYAFVGASAYGILTSGPTLTNSGVLNVTATGGTADANDPEAYADTTAYAYGISGHETNVVNTGDMTVAGTAGTLPTGGAYSYAEIFGIYTSNGSLTNEGAVTVSGQGGIGGATSYAQVYGLWGYGSTNVNNDGTIAVMAVGGTADANTPLDPYAYALAYGIQTAEGDVDNTAAITVEATGGTADANDAHDYAHADAGAYGIDSDGDVGNTGVLTVTATGGTADADDSHADGSYTYAYADADAYGIRSNAYVNNTGALTVSATGGTTDGNAEAHGDADADASGIYALSDVDNSGDLTIMVTGGTANAIDSEAYAGADGGAFGINSRGDVNNVGDFTVSAAAGLASANDEAYARADATGIYASHSVNNSGNFTVTATANTADANDGTYAYAGTEGYGIEAGRDVDNAGNLTVTATGGTANANTYAYADVDVYGIDSDGNVNNTGDLTVTGTGGTAASASNDSSVHATGIAAFADVRNTGNLTINATAEVGATAYAYGIHLTGSGTLTNTGVIRTSGDSAYELYMASGITTTLIDTYNVTLEGNPNNASIHVGEDATLALNDATLTVANVTVNTLWDTPYQLFDTEPNGVVDGSFAVVRALNPNTTATYYDQNSVDSSDDKVALSYTPNASPALPSTAVEKQVVTQAIDVVNRHMTSLMLHDVFSSSGGALLADAGATARSMGLAQSGSDDEAGAFFEPYYSRVDRDADPMGYDARLWGFAAGYERRLDNTLVGLHMGYGRANVDYTGAGFSANSEDQDILTGGFSGLTRWDEWTLRYSLTGFYGWHDYKGLTGAALDENETASTDSYGLNASVMAGHIFRHGPHVFLPEAGLNWLWAHRQRYTTEASDPAWDTTYSAMDDHDLQAEAALRWLGGFIAGDIHVSPSASIGVRHLLTDAESTVSQSVAGTAPVLVKSERDRTAMTTSGSIVLSQGSQALSLAYDGEYSSDTDRHSFWLRYAWTF